MMDISNIFQSLMIMALYALLVLFVPSLVMKKRLSNQRMYERFIIYVVFGNFYIINIVFILQLIHISNMFTLLVLYLAPVLYVLIKPRAKDIKRTFLDMIETADRLLKGSLGFKTYLKSLGRAVGRQCAEWVQKLSVIRNRQNIEGIAVAGVVILVCVMYGSNSIKNYGYLASDIAVHNYWINAMTENNIFVAGVYPHGFHCVIYFMHEIFGIDVSVLLRLFAMTNAVFVHMVLWAFIRYLTRSRYAAYGALVIFVAVNFINSGCYSRYSCDLPQEYGMIFIFPTLYFLFEYMKHERTRGKKDKAYRIRKRYELAGAACSFSLTIAVHFYGTMIIGLFCVAMMIAYWMRFPRPRFFLRLMAALFAGIFIAALPMGVSIAQGNHFQGSIGWGLNIIKSSGEQSSQSGNVTKSAGYDDDIKEAGIDDKSGADSSNGSTSSDSQTANSSDNGSSAVSKPVKQNPVIVLKDKVLNKCRALFAGFHKTLDTFVINEYSDVWAYIMVTSIVIVFVYGVVLAIADWKNYDSDYGCQYVTVAFGVLFTIAILIASYLKLPAIMDVNRGRIYYMYSFTIIIGIILDMIPGIIARFIKKRHWIYNIPSLVISVAIVAGLLSVYGLRPVAINSRRNLMQTNGAVYCMYKIMDEHKHNDNNWTIVSPSDELRMLAGRGYHYELSDLVRKLKRSSKFTLPTKEVYVFIEKKPLDYTITSKYSDKEVSEEGASQTYADYYSGNTMYKGEARYILMSKMYYWAKRYQEIYPEDFTVYYEDDEFICYRLVQNTSFLNNLMVDYGYNR